MISSMAVFILLASNARWRVAWAKHVDASPPGGIQVSTTSTGHNGNLNSAIFSTQDAHDDQYSRSLENTTKCPTPSPGEYGDPKQVTTTFEEGSGAHGVFFTITARERLLVQSLDFHTDRTEPIEVKVWAKIGGYRGYEAEESSWWALSSATVRGAGQGKPTVIPESEFDDVEIDLNMTASLYIVLTTEDLRYSIYDNLAVGSTFIRTPALEFHVGTGVSGFIKGGTENQPAFHFKNSMFPGRVFNGVIHYRVSHDSNAAHNRTVSASKSEKIATTFDGRSTGFGAMFDVVAKKAIHINSIDVHLATKERTRVDVWTKSGTHVGHEANRSLWEKLVEEFVIGEGVGRPTPIPAVFDALQVDQGRTQSFYVTITTTSMGYTAVEEPVGTEFRANDDMQLLVGTGVAYPFGKTYTPRAFNGAIHYLLSEAPTTSASPTFSPAPKPTRTPATPIFTQQRIRLWGGTAKRVLRSTNQITDRHRGLEVSESSFLFFENVTKTFLQESVDLEDVSVLSVSVPRNTNTDDISISARPDNDHDVLDMYTTITGEYYPPPHINFGKLVEDIFEERGEVFLDQLKEDPAFEEVRGVSATEVIFPLPKPLDKPQESNKLENGKFLTILCIASVTFTLFIFLLVSGYVLRKRSKEKLAESKVSRPFDKEDVNSTFQQLQHQ